MNARLTADSSKRPRSKGDCSPTDRPRLVGADGPVPEPRPVPAPCLALSQRR